MTTQPATSEREFHLRIAALEAEHPSISDEQIQAIEATLPRCPECGSGIDKVHFIAHETHSFEIQIDGSNGDILAYSQHHDTIDREPNGKDMGKWLPPAYAAPSVPVRLAIEVECENQHQWLEPRLKWDGAGEWTVLPAEAVS